MGREIHCLGLILINVHLSYLLPVEFYSRIFVDPGDPVVQLLHKPIAKASCMLTNGEVWASLSNMTCYSTSGFHLQKLSKKF